VKEKDHEITVLKANVRALVDSKQLLKRTLSELRTELQRKISENHDLHQKLESQRCANAALVTENGELRSSSESLKRQLVSYRDELKASLQSDTTTLSTRPHLDGLSPWTLDNERASRSSPVNQPASASRSPAKAQYKDAKQTLAMFNTDHESPSVALHLSSHKAEKATPSEVRSGQFGGMTPAVDGDDDKKPAASIPRKNQIFPELSAAAYDSATDKPVPSIFQGATFKPTEKDDINWEKRFQSLKTFLDQKGRFPKGKESFGGFGLASWVANQRRFYHQLMRGNETAKISYARVEKLGAIVGFDWGETREEIAAKWKAHFAQLRKYKEEYGDFRVPASFVADGMHLGGWVYKQRRAYRHQQEGKTACITKERIAQLNDIGFDWNI